MPLEEELSFDGENADLAPFVFKLKPVDTKQCPDVVSYGAIFEAFCGGADFSKDNFFTGMPYPLSENFLDLYSATLRHGMPIANCGEWLTAPSRTNLKYRMMLFPLSTGNVIADLVLGVIGLKEERC